MNAQQPGEQRPDHHQVGHHQAADQQPVQEQPTALPVDAGDGWRRVHPVTPVLLVWQVLAAVVAILVFQVGQELIGTGGWEFVLDHLGTVLLWLGAGILALIVVTGIYSALSWRKMRYRVDADGVELNQGILFRQERRAPLNRVQAVDVQQPLLGRIFGLARVRVETAGAADSRVDVAFLKLADAEALRAEILARAAGVDLDQVRIVAERAAAGDPVDDAALVDAARHGGAPDATDGDNGDDGEHRRGRSPRDPLLAARTGYREAPERVVFEVDNSRLVASSLLSPGFIVIALMLVGALVFLIVGLPLGAMVSFIPGVLGAGAFVWGRFSGAFSFTSATSPDGIRVRRGLLETTSQTIPPRRVQAVRLTQPWLWRWRGWWRVQGYIAGYGVTEGSFANESSTLMPVGTRADALTALWLVVPDIGVDDVPAVLDAGLDGAGEDAGFVTSPRRARWFDPFAWRRQGVLVTREAILLRTGWLARRLEVVPHGRTQSVGLVQGPIERRLRLANLAMHTVAGPGQPGVPHLDEQVALDLLRGQAERARQARHHEGPEEWARRVSVLGDGPQDEGTGPAPTAAGAPPDAVAQPGAVAHPGGAARPDAATHPATGAPPGAAAHPGRRGPDGGGWAPDHTPDPDGGPA